MVALSKNTTQSKLYVYGTADKPSDDLKRQRMEMANHAANWSAYRNAFLGRVMIFPRVLAALAISSHPIIARYADQLPMHLKQGSNDLALFYVYPLNGRYVAVNSGLPWWANADNIGLPFPAPANYFLNRFKDFMLFKGSVKDVIIEGYFDENWKLNEEHKAKLREYRIDLTRK